jgi:hypothetical protein
MREGRRNRSLYEIDGILNNRNRHGQMQVMFCSALPQLTDLQEKEYE